MSLSIMSSAAFDTNSRTHMVQLTGTPLHLTP